MDSDTYIIAQTDQADEDERLAILTEIADGFTRQHCRHVGIAPGWNCLEVGAGSGTVAAWMGEQVAPGGRVVATDLDTSRLDELPTETVSVRAHDVLDGPVERDAFDLVHCRVVLLHLLDPLRALRNMVASLRPGGWLVVEDIDFTTFRSATPQHPLAAGFDAAMSRTWSKLDEAGVMQPYLGAHMVGLFDQLDVDDTESLGRYTVWRGRGLGARFWSLSTAETAPLLIDAEILTEDDVACLRAAFADPTFAFVPGVATTTWARRSTD
jgi:2-polyprenyl-3-methyl-5-hydroxy-6-metoxy-1,4-benzoquinol methylase